MEYRDGNGGSKVIDSDSLERGETAIITEIQRFSVHDGPGIRTLVFFKGCPLRCRWCQNPETQTWSPELMYDKNRCIRCGLCLETCSQKAISYGPDGLMQDWGRCCLCGKCEQICYAEARRVVGKQVTVDEVYDEVTRDIVFYKNSGGGVTLGGGEPTVYPKFAIKILQRLKETGIHTAIETCGHCNWDDLQKIIRYTDLVLYDIKHPDPQIHKLFTSVSNSLILENLTRIRQDRRPIIIRFPLIPGVNDDENFIRGVAEIAKADSAIEIYIMPFHQMGESKWYALNKDYACSTLESPSPDSVERARRIFARSGIPVNVGGSGIG